MTIDQETLAGLASYTDPVTGVSERFVPIALRSGSTVGVLATPGVARRSPAFLLCHSFGREQATLGHTDAVVARRLAMAGHAVLRFHSQGYGDSEHPQVRATVASQVEDALDAVKALTFMVEGSTIGTIGIRFGGAVAALVADRLGLGDVVLVSPVTDGARAMNEILRGLAMTRIASAPPSTASTAPPVEALRELLEEQGYLDHKGYALTREAVEENGRLKLETDLVGFHGRALLVQVSASDRPQGAIDRLARRLVQLGATVERRTVVHPRAALLGVRHVRLSGADVAEDTLADLSSQIAEAVVAQAADRAPGEGTTA